jgi:hypothetical protein
LIYCLTKKHLKIDGLKEIISLKASMNKGLSANLKQSFPALIAYEILLIDYADPNFNFSNITLNPFWLSGFFNAEGCFECRIKKSSFVKIGYQVELRITLVQHSRDTLLFNIIRDFLKMRKFSER